MIGFELGMAMMVIAWLLVLVALMLAAGIAVALHAAEVAGRRACERCGDGYRPGFPSP